MNVVMVSKVGAYLGLMVTCIVLKLKSNDLDLCQQRIWFSLPLFVFESLEHVCCVFSFRSYGLCLFTVFENCFLFWKTRRTRKTQRICLVPSFFLFRKRQNIIENTKFKEQEGFAENTKMVVLNVFKNCSQ